MIFIVSIDAFFQDRNYGANNFFGFFAFQFADAAYTEYEWEDYLRETENIKLPVNRKKNSKRGESLAINFYKFRLRHPIETSVGEVEKMFPKKNACDDAFRGHHENRVVFMGFSARYSLYSITKQSDKIIER